MLFTAWTFWLFLAIVLIVYFSLSRWWRWQNIVLLLASYTFYGFWDWRFSGLLLGITLVNYGAGWAIDLSTSTPGRRRLWLIAAIVVDLCVLGVFKYFNFFDEGLVSLLSHAGLHLDPVTLKIVLPLGISFFTFMSITYPFDIYRRKLVPACNFLDFALFVSFFPTIVSGPVERASHLLPQFQAPRQITSAKINEALWLIVWGLFQKMVVADNLGLLVNQVYSNYHHFSGFDIILAILAYSVQILADFGGYTDIARGVARLFGFDLLLNFNVPYFALNPSDFWSRWHISLSQWFRDYLYIPLGGNRKGNVRTSLNLLITMVLVGLWHGASWTFVIWGAWHGMLQVIYRFFGKAGQSAERKVNGWTSVLSIGGRAALMFVLVAAGWAVFRAESFSQVSYLFTHLGFGFSINTVSFGWRLVFFCLPLAVVQFFQARANSPVFMALINPWALGMVYGCCLVGIIVFSQHNIVRFIYQGF
jgi:alginate O-acetyltransferase complex protein AlgI